MERNTGNTKKGTTLKERIKSDSTKTSGYSQKRNGKRKRSQGKKPDWTKYRRLIELLAVLIFGIFLLFSVLRMGGRATVPYTYDELIERYARQNGLEKELVAAVIYQESRFDSDVESHKGAKGLMQIMPETAQWISARMDLDYEEKMLFDPETSIKMGTWYLSYLLDRYQGNERLALAAYNAGPGNVDEWIEDDSLYYGEYLHNIPFDETSGYVENIEKMKKVYKDMYPDTFKESVAPKDINDSGNDVRENTAGEKTSPEVTSADGEE